MNLMGQDPALKNQKGLPRESIPFIIDERYLMEI